MVVDRKQNEADCFAVSNDFGSISLKTCKLLIENWVDTSKKLEIKLERVRERKLKAINVGI